MDVVPVQQCSSQSGTAWCIRHCEQAHCCGEAATICLTTTLVSCCTRSEAYAARSLRRLVDWSSSSVTKSRCERCPSYRRTWPIWLKLLTFDCPTFFGLIDVWNMHWLLWHLVSGSYSKIHASSPVITLRSKSGLKRFDHVLAHLKAVLLLIIIQ